MKNFNHTPRTASEIPLDHTADERHAEQAQEQGLADITQYLIDLGIHFPLTTPSHPHHRPGRPGTGRRSP